VAVAVAHVTKLLRSPGSGRLTALPQTVEGRFDGSAARERGRFCVCRVATHMTDFDSNEGPIGMPGSSQGGSRDGAPFLARRVHDIADSRPAQPRRLLERPAAIAERRRNGRAGCPSRGTVIGRAPARRSRLTMSCHGKTPGSLS
jgi:hypothetical protein